jgi:hypothetical protein
MLRSILGPTITSARIELPWPEMSASLSIFYSRFALNIGTAPEISPPPLSRTVAKMMFAAVNRLLASCHLHTTCSDAW